jgi:hypothetical protein
MEQYNLRNNIIPTAKQCAAKDCTTTTYHYKYCCNCKCPAFGCDKLGLKKYSYCEDHTCTYIESDKSFHCTEPKLTNHYACYKHICMVKSDCGQLRKYKPGVGSSIGCYKHTCKAARCINITHRFAPHSEYCMDHTCTICCQQRGDIRKASVLPLCNDCIADNKYCKYAIKSKNNKYCSASTSELGSEYYHEYCHRHRCQSGPERCFNVVNETELYCDIHACKFKSVKDNNVKFKSVKDKNYICYNQTINNLDYCKYHYCTKHNKPIEECLKIQCGKRICAVTRDDPFTGCLQIKQFVKACAKNKTPFTYYMLNDIVRECNYHSLCGKCRLRKDENMMMARYCIDCCSQCRVKDNKVCKSHRLRKAPGVEEALAAAKLQITLLPGIGSEFDTAREHFESLK